MGIWYGSGSVQLLPTCSLLIHDKQGVIPRLRWTKLAYSCFVKEHADSQSVPGEQLISQECEQGVLLLFVVAAVGVLKWEYYSRQKDHIISVLKYCFFLPALRR